MAQTTFSVRIDEDIKREFDYICQEFGMSVSTAINIFARTVVREKRIPFIISLQEKTAAREELRQAVEQIRAEAEENGISEMTLDEINDEIAAARKDMK